MMPGINRDEWYALRDDRTLRVDGVNGFEDFSLGVIINDRVFESYSLQVMSCVSLNMIARWCQNVIIDMPSDFEAIVSKFSDQDFPSYLKQLMESIDPFGQFEFKSLSDEPVDCILSIGPAEPKMLREDVDQVWINADGWIAGYGINSILEEIKCRNDFNPVGPAFAACLGVGEIFKRAIGWNFLLDTTVWYSVYDFQSSQKFSDLNNPTIPDWIDIGNVYQIGCGAVASSLDYILSLSNWKANITLIDYDQVAISNCNRSLSFTAREALTHENKIDSCKETLKNTDFVTKTFQGSYDELIEKGIYLDSPPDLILCLANAKNVWSNIQYNYPPLVLHSTTTKNWGINFGRHIPIEEWCILCRFKEETEHEFVPECGESQITQEKDEEPIYGVLPFLSASSACFTLAEIGKLAYHNYPVNSNFIQFSLKANNTPILQNQYRSKQDCACRYQSVAEYPLEIILSKYWRLSTVSN